MRYMDCENIFNTKKKDTWLITFPSIKNKQTGEVEDAHF